MMQNERKALLPKWIRSSSVHLFFSSKFDVYRRLKQGVNRRTVEQLSNLRLKNLRRSLRPAEVRRKLNDSSQEKPRLHLAMFIKSLLRILSLSF